MNTPEFVIELQLGTIYSHFILRSVDGRDEIRIITGGEREDFSVSVQCFLRGVKRAYAFSSGPCPTFVHALESVANIVRHLAVGDLANREALLDAARRFSTTLLPVGRVPSPGVPPVGRVSRRSAPLEAPTQPNVSPSPSPEGEGRGEGSCRAAPVGIWPVPCPPPTSRAFIISAMDRHSLIPSWHHSVTRVIWPLAHMDRNCPIVSGPRVSSPSEI